MIYNHTVLFGSSILIYDLVFQNVVPLVFVLGLIKSKQGFRQRLVSFKRINGNSGFCTILACVDKFVDMFCLGVDPHKY